jgi:AcrR family transcriptional regulator
MTATDRPLRRDAEENRLKVVEAARELFARRGLGVTLNDVAHQAGVGVGTVYRRYPDKEQLIDELFEERLGELVAMAEQAVDDSDPWRGLTSFLRRNLELQSGDRGFREVVQGSAEGLERISRERAKIWPLVENLVERAKESGQLRADFGHQDVLMLVLMLGTVIDCSRDIHPDLWRRYLAIIIQGLRAQPAEPEPLPIPSLRPDQVDAVIEAWRPPR